MLQKNKIYHIISYSLMNASPFSHTSTILAFGLHSDSTTCKASANFFSRKFNQTHKEKTAPPRNHKMKYQAPVLEVNSTFPKHKKSKQKKREILTVDNFSSGFILGNNLRRGEIQLSLFSFIVRHIHQSYKYPRTCNSNNKNIYSAKAKAEIRNEKMKNENENIPSNSKNGQKQRKGSKG